MSSSSSIAVTSPASTTEELTKKVREILGQLTVWGGEPSPEEYNLATARIMQLFVNTNIDGGVYFIRITAVGKEIVKFFRKGVETDDFVLCKIGRADNYKNRFSQFRFKYERVLLVNGDNCMEKDLKSLLPANMKNYFFGTEVRKAVVDRAFGITGGNNGVTEWRVLSRKKFDALVRNAPRINSLNWRDEFTRSFYQEFDEKELTIKLGERTICTNKVIVRVI
jgi:hypothetical protein